MGNIQRSPRLSRVVPRQKRRGLPDEAVEGCWAGLRGPAALHRRCDPDPRLGFYADDVELSIVAADVPQTSFFELGGESEVAKHLRAVYGQRASWRVEWVVVDEGRVKFREACEYPDGSRVLVETTLEVRDGKIGR